MKFNRKVLSTLLLLALATSVAAQSASNLHVNFKDIKLQNGLRVILVEDHNAPVVALSVTYNVGSRNEKPGRTGFAHLFEHMMFQGSENVGKSEHFILIQNNGGTMNGTTNEDRTNYFEALPSNQLELSLFLESDRMRSLAVTQDNLDNQRNAVQDLALLDSFKSRRPVEELRAEAARRFNGSRPQDWWNPRPPLADRPSLEWTNDEIDAASAQTRPMLAKTAANSWENVHEFVMQLAMEVK